MGVLAVLALLVTVLASFSLLAMAVGADSRPGFGDDQQQAFKQREH